MNTHFVVQRVQDRTLWAGENRWCHDPIGARWFETETDATQRARAVLGDRTLWRVIPWQRGAA